MPGRLEHSNAGILIGAGAAALVAPTTDPVRLAMEIFAGGLGGHIGGVLPDVLEPAVSSHHRNIAHSVVGGGAMVLATYVQLQAHCRTSAARCEQRAAALVGDPAGASRAGWEGLAWHFLAALLVGVAAGYASHMVMDAATPRGIPFVVS